MRWWQAMGAAMRHPDRVNDLVGINRRNVELVYAYNRRRDYPLVDDKIRCKELLTAAGVPVAPTLAICEGLFAVDRVVGELRERANFVVKPASGSGGDGIVVLGERTETGWETVGGRPFDVEDLQQHLANTVFGAYSKQLEDRALVEERVVPHALFTEFYPRGLSDIRLIFLEGRCLMAMTRLPADASGGRANLHQGGLGVAIDLETGRTTRAVRYGRVTDVHPDSGAQLIGRQLPHWAETLEVGRRAAEAVPLGYIGADLVIDAVHGPLVLELNARPGLEIQNVNGRPLGPVLAEGAA